MRDALHPYELYTMGECAAFEKAETRSLLVAHSVTDAVLVRGRQLMFVSEGKQVGDLLTVPEGLCFMDDC